ncbi:MAG: hypothetical protein HQM14_06920 [SAR324 cluster bacterium]|nr:hypothetical protein [SAR324 cluster bacterium]
MYKKILLTFREINHRCEEEQWDLRDFSWKLHYGERIQLHCHRPEQYDVLWRLLERNLKPKQGVIEELRPVTWSSNYTINSRLNMDDTMNDALQSKLFEERLWVAGKRTHVQNLMDRLQINLFERRQPLQTISSVSLQRFQALLFMAARVQLLLGKQLFHSMDETTSAVFQEWNQNFCGTLVISGSSPNSLIDFDTVITINKDGTVLFT